MQVRAALVVAVCLVLLLPALVLAEPQVMPSAQGGELLKNPGLDGPMWFKSQCCDEGGNPINEVQVAENWTAWWLEMPPGDVVLPDNCERRAQWGCYWMRPEFVDSARTLQTNRIHGGDNSQKYFSFGRMHEAGLYQRVTGVAPGARLHFSVFMSAWMCIDPADCNAGFRSDNPTTMHMRVGIDPFGGTDPFSSNIVWSGEVDSFDHWTQYSVEAVAQADSVTVFTHSRPEWTAPRLDNDVYVDDASLVKVGEGAVAPTPTGQPGAAPTQAPGATTPAPCARLRFVEDVTIPDGSPVAPGAQFAKTWRVQNTGTCVISGTLSFIGSGNQMSGQSPTNLSNIEPGQTADVSLKLTAPTLPGAYQGTWQARASDGTVLENLFLKITVTGQAAAPSPTVAPPATATKVSQVATPPQSPLATPALPPTPPPLPTATPVLSGLCVGAFEDTNNNTLRDGNEPGLAGVTFAVLAGGSEVARYATEGSALPYCLTTLPPGAYSVQVTLPPGYTAALEKADVALALGQRVDLVVAARRGEKATPTLAATTQPKAPAVSNTALIAVVLFAGVAVILIVIAFIIIRRRGL